MKKIGTILPTAKSISLTNQWASKNDARKNRIAAKELRHCSRAVVGGETRYYESDDKYAVVSNKGKILWFRVTPEGDFAVR